MTTTPRMRPLHFQCHSLHSSPPRVIGDDVGGANDLRDSGVWGEAMGDFCDLGVRNGELWDMGVMGDTTSGGGGDGGSTSIKSDSISKVTFGVKL